MHVCQAFYQQMSWVTKADLEAMACPVLQIVGQGDRVTPVDFNHAIRDILQVHDFVKCLVRVAARVAGGRGSRVGHDTEQVGASVGGKESRWLVRAFAGESGCQSRPVGDVQGNSKRLAPSNAGESR